MIDLREALTRAASQLAADPALRPAAVPDAALLLMHALGIDRASMLAHPERPVTRQEQAAVQRLVEQRLLFAPIQYITGTQEFFGLELRVTPAVLIPRPETEILVEAVLSRLPRDIPRRIVDVGTGSGAIALALTDQLRDAVLTAVDISPEALALAGENALLHKLETRVRFLQSDLLAAVQYEPPFDAIVSNPPYVPVSDRDTLHPQVRDHEPAQALFAGPDGLDVYRRLIPQAHALLKPSGLLALEIGHGQRDAIAALLDGWQNVEFLADLQGIPRVAVAHRPR